MVGRSADRKIVREFRTTHSLERVSELALLVVDWAIPKTDAVRLARPRNLITGSLRERLSSVLRFLSFRRNP
jgi:hypothetical protein